MEADCARAGIMANFGGEAPDTEKAFDFMRVETEYRVELYNKIVGTCFEKCIGSRFGDGELNVGENACVDRW